jgi:hypothetical protein
LINAADPHRRRYRLISCEVFYRELCHLVALSPHQIDIEFLPKGLHDIGSAPMVQRIQEVVDHVPPGQYQALLFGYGLCNNGIDGLQARDIPLIIPRAHDCMTLFFGSRKRYMDFFNDNPGTYFFTSGWLERGEAEGDLRQLSISHRMGMDATYDELVAKYGEENAQFLYEQLGSYGRQYRQATFIEMPVGPQEDFRRRAEEHAQEKGWRFTREQGDLRLLQMLVNGNWNEDEFLTVSPGERVAVTYDEGIITAARIQP